MEVTSILPSPPETPTVSPLTDRKVLLREMGVRDSHILDLKRALAEQSGEIGDTAFSTRRLKFADDSDTPESDSVDQHDIKKSANELVQQNLHLSSALEKKLFQLRTENRNLSSRCEALEKGERALSQSLSQAEQKKQKAEHALKDHLKEANTDLNLAMKELEAVKHRLNEKDALLKTLRDKADLADALMADVERLRSEVDAFRALQVTNENTVQAERLSFQARIRELEDALQRERKEARELLQIEKKNSGRSTGELRNCRLQLNRKTTEVIHYKRLTKVWQKEAKRNHEEIQNHITIVEAQTKQIHQMKKQLLVLKQALDEEKIKSKDLKAEVELLNEEFDKNDSRHKRVISQLQPALDKAIFEAKTSYELLDQHRHEAVGLSREVSELHVSNERMQDRTRQAELLAREEYQLRKDLEDKLRHVLRNLNDLERERIQYGSRLSALQTELHRATARTHRAKAGRGRIKEKLRSLHNLLIRLKSQHEYDTDRYSREIEQLHQHVAFKDGQLQNLRNLVKAYQNRLENAERQLQSLRQKALNIYDHERVLNKVILTSEGTIRSMRLQLHELKSQVYGEHGAHDVIESATRNLLDDLKTVKRSLRESKAKVRSKKKIFSKEDYGTMLYRSKSNRNRSHSRFPIRKNRKFIDEVVSPSAIGD